jgi:hypothetical protein
VLLSLLSRVLRSGRVLVGRGALMLSRARVVLGKALSNLLPRVLSAWRVLLEAVPRAFVDAVGMRKMLARIAVFFAISHSLNSRLNRSDELSDVGSDCCPGEH